MDDRQFDNLSRRVGALALPRLPRRGLLGVLGGATLAGALGLVVEPEPAEAKKCKKEDQKCDKKKCKKKNKKCCCKKLKCKNGRCKGKSKGPTCLTDLDLSNEEVWTTFDSEDGPDEFNRPWGIDTDPDGNVYVTDRDNERVLAFNQNGNLIGEFGDAGQGGNDFQNPLGIGFNERSNGNLRLYVADDAQNENDDKIRNFEGDLDDPDFGDLDQRLGNDTGVNNIFPFGVAVDPNERVWIVNR